MPLRLPRHGCAVALHLPTLPPCPNPTCRRQPQEDEGQEGDGEADDSALFSAFYGPWQTRPWKPPAAQGGRVPRNERGNVEVPPFVSQLPEGTVRGQLGRRRGGLT